MAVIIFLWWVNLGVVISAYLAKQFWMAIEFDVNAVVLSTFSVAAGIKKISPKLMLPL